MPEKNEVEDDGDDKTQNRQYPNDKCPEHAEEDDRLQMIFASQNANINKELRNGRLSFWSGMFTFGN